MNGGVETDVPGSTALSRVRQTGGRCRCSGNEAGVADDDDHAGPGSRRERPSDVDGGHHIGARRRATRGCLSAGEPSGHLCGLPRGHLLCFVDLVGRRNGGMKPMPVPMLSIWRNPRAQPRALERGRREPDHADRGIAMAHLAA